MIILPPREKAEYLLMFANQHKIKFFMNRQDYLNAVKSQLEQNIFYHSLALEACNGWIT